MFSGISGLQSHSTWLDVIGNNISNVNTIAYKASRVEFADQISQTLSGGQGDNQGANLGGVNPEQVGLGTRVASIQTLFTEGTIQNTGNSTDMAIVGDGFLLSKSGNQTLLTRAGNLTFDGTGNLVDQNGGLIQGFNAKVEYNQIPLHNGGLVPPLVITDASLKLDNTNISQISNINIKRDFILPPKATTQIQFSGNMDSFQQANQSGGILELNPAGAAPQLPFVIGGGALNGQSANLIPNPNGLGGTVVQQVDNFSDPVNASTEVYIDPVAGKQLITGAVIDTGQVTLLNAQANVTNAWQQQPPVPPAHVMSETVYDSLGNARSVTIQLYQVNDLGTANPPVNTPPMNQVLYAWYAFDTTAGAAVSNASLIGGTGIWEGDTTGAGGVGYDRGVNGDQYYGDFLHFNTDGSLAGLGGALVQGAAANATAARPAIYLPPIQDVNQVPAPPVSPIPNIGAEVTRVYLDFGTAGLLGGPGVANPGLRDGVYSDAEGSYQVISGVNTYVPNSTAYAKTQNGYTDGQLTGVSFDKLGDIVGSFTNGQNVALAQVVLAMPNNQGGLAKVGSNYYAQSANSGPLFVGTAGQLGMGTVQGNSLELSNVDLTVELSNMIIAQRGFEVNARVISVTNSTLQTTVQLGQGG